MTCCNILETLTNDSLLIKEYKYWYLNLRAKAKTLGTSVLITKDHFSTMSEIPQEAITELSEITKQLESIFNNLFKPDKYNYQMNMMKENHTHFNIFPRYAKETNYQGVKWTDTGWPLLIGENLEISENILQNVAKDLQREFLKI